ncbi:MAG: thioredoxin family protein [Salibacteraceae bacterium]
MALTETTDKPLGFEAPEFKLQDVVSGSMVGLNELRGSKATVVMFICNHCPYVVHVREKLIELARNYMAKGVGFIAISSNDVVRYPDDSPQKMKDLALELDFPFAYLFDETQTVARAYDAVCTPDFSVFDSDLKCVYRGRMDDSTPGNGKPVTGHDLSACLDALIAGKQLKEKQYPSMGCSIKWKK